MRERCCTSKLGGEDALIPFSLDRASREGLADQLYNGIVKAVEDGAYREGDRVPTWKEIADEFGVSQRVPREAFRRLTAEGVVSGRPRLGYRVVGRSGRRKWKGAVLLVAYEDDGISYYHNAFAASLRAGLERAGYLLVQSEVRRKAAQSFDYSVVEPCFAFGLDFAVVACHHISIRKWVSRRGIPFLWEGLCDGTVANCVGDFPECAFAPAAESFAAHCVRAGVRKVEQLSFSSTRFDAAPSLRAVGVEVEKVVVSPLKGMPRLESIRSAGERYMAKRLSGGRHLPDAFLFTDDFLAQGALTAMLAAGLDIPEEVKVATLANEGNLPVFSKSLAVLLNRPAKSGAAVARYVLDYFAGRHSPLSPISYRYIPGDTFPET